MPDRTPPPTEPLTAEEIAQWVEYHAEAKSGGWCGGCGVEWPCNEARLLATLDAARQPVPEADALREALDGLAPFLVHWPTCAAWKDEPCSCGLNDAKTAVLDATRSPQ